MNLLTTKQAAAAIGVSLTRLEYAIRYDKVRPSVRDCTGRFWWSDADLSAARTALANDRRRKPVPAMAS